MWALPPGQPIPTLVPPRPLPGQRKRVPESSLAYSSSLQGRGAGAKGLWHRCPSWPGHLPPALPHPSSQAVVHEPQIRARLAALGTGGSGHWWQRPHSERLRLILKEKPAEAGLTPLSGSAPLGLPGWGPPCHLAGAAVGGRWALSPGPTSRAHPPALRTPGSLRQPRPPGPASLEGGPREQAAPSPQHTDLTARRETSVLGPQGLHQQPPHSRPSWARIPLGMLPSGALPHFSLPAPPKPGAPKEQSPGRGSGCQLLPSFQEVGEPPAQERRIRAGEKAQRVAAGDRLAGPPGQAWEVLGVAQDGGSAVHV